MEDNYSQDDQKVLDSLNKAVDEGPWEKTLFLRAIGQKLQLIRDKFRKDLHIGAPTQENSLSQAHLAAKMAKHTGQAEIFISLYNSSGGDITSWEKLLHSMGKQVISRPIFQAEDDVRELIRSKINKKNEAYISVYVGNNDIMSPPGGKSPLDALGHKLLVVREGAVKLSNIAAFMHKSGQYTLKKGKLIRQGDIETLDFN